MDPSIYPETLLRRKRKRGTKNAPGHHLTLIMASCFLLFLRTSCCIAAESTMKCQTADQAIVCEIPLELVKADSSSTLEGCDEEYCVKATVTKNMPPPPMMESYSETVQDSDSSTIRVGSLVYEEPYTQYGRDVAAILQSRPRIRSDTPEVERDFVLASFYAQLGPAHRTRAQGLGDTVDWEGKDGLACIESLTQAIQHYERAEPYLSDVSRHKTARAYANPDDTRIAIANAHSYLADAYQAEKKTKPLAQDHLRAAERIYRDVLDQPIDPPLPTDIRGDVELNLAETLTRTGVLLMDSINGEMLDQELQQVQIDLSKSTGFSTQSIGEFSGDWTHLMKKVEEANQMFADGIPLFQKQAQAASTDDSDYTYLHIQLATALQHHGSATMFLADLDKTIALWEEALAIYRKLYPLLGGESQDQADVNMGMAELMYSLSDVLLQNGSYAKSQQYYEDSMDWYLVHGITQPPVQRTMLDEDETLNLYETTLEQYHSMLHGGPGLHIPDDGGMLYEPDELYEADIHATLGAIRLARDEAVLAIDHFQAAVTRYEGDNAEDAAIADVKINMALALLRLEEYKESARVHGEALEIYRKTVGEGKNPFTDGLPFDLGGTKGEDEQDGKDDQKKPGVHERLINLDDYRAGLLNMTAAMDEL